ncbi:hypothetical protein SARC_01015 [Sphaeroforma arctica JP610]|uniref:Uncharacterized protein n=1 Tax=Sphaeroforma arctica JP610 TaxID=667725 RepID=A0A0L0GD83_9EUKA|nr:hypothetical protein SARC_01015 [Sphaeroforma arctica JP610]KNC86869.1 hypothetical protein SARC_01015 [Sphaeroforma arctica JP610]|eukprot:XP_014160771.1 hypothetical protein SARC_01015 [Sphaeroforma arctica JP610]
MDALAVRKAHWQKIWSIPNTPWTIKGYSRSAYRTGFIIPELNVMLDAGPQHFSTPHTVLVTHAHIDHIANLPLTLIGDAESGLVTDVYGPQAAEKYIRNYIHAMFEANAMQEIDEIDWYRYKGVSARDVIRMPIKKTLLEMQVFECDHAVPTVSYGLSEVKQKLKQEYLGKDGKVIAQLRKDGVSITQEVVVKRLAYVCDTSIRVFEMNPGILEYPVIFIECTFLFDDELQNAMDTQHIHWQQLKQYVETHSHIEFMLFHFSLRYKDSEINSFFREITANGLSNLRWWTNQPDAQ